jgi:hypothetical protein
MNNTTIEFEELPVEIQSIIDKHYEDTEYIDSYQNCKDLLAKLNKLDYTFDYGLDGIPYDFREILSYN